MTVRYVDANQVALPVAAAGPLVRVTVAVARNGREVHRASWLLAASE